ncbi:hypothetical protein BU17DRAFT_58508 [Hysterangium stoloniferum]|nr:hypothetical protein BU17DRAFT_58508 [Hysterangium stoloniferum]
MNLGQLQQPPRHPPALPAVPAYTLIAVGPPRTGKSSLLRLLLDTSPISPHATPTQLESLARFLTPSTQYAFSECEVELLWAGERVLLRLIDTPSLNYPVEDDLDRTLRDILALIEDRYIEGARDRDDGESHIHLCLYVLDPQDIAPPSLNLKEISVIRKLSNRVNVLPILGRSDAITVEQCVLRSIISYNPPIDIITA